MKKYLPLIVTILLLRVSAWGAADVLIGSGTATNMFVPINSCLSFTYSQQIVLGTEIMAAGGGSGPVYKIRFFYTGGGAAPGSWTNWDIYLGNTTVSSFPTNTSWIPRAHMTLVYSGVFPAPLPGTWVEFILTTPFTYTGDNLVVAVDENVFGGGCTANWQSYNSATNRAMTFSDMVVNPNPLTPPPANNGPFGILAQIMFSMTPFISLTPLPVTVVFPTDGMTMVEVGATLKWKPATMGGIPTGYLLYFDTVSPPSFIGDLGNDTTWDPPGDMEHLTTYIWKVEPYNQQGIGDTIPSPSFTTGPDPTITVFPHCEEFETPRFPPYGWTNEKTGGTGVPGTWNRQIVGADPTCTPLSPPGMMRYNCRDYPAGTSGILVTPPSSFPTSYFRVKFWMYRDNGYDTAADHVNVYYNHSIPELVGATLLGTINRSVSLSPVVGENGWYEYSFNMPSGSAGISRYVIFEGVSSNGNNIFIDQICLEPLPPCPAPESLAAAPYGYDALLSWTETGTATSWDVECVEVSAVFTGTPTGLGVANPYILSGLTPLTDYKYRVRPVCPTGEGQWSSPFTFFTTLPAPLAITGSINHVGCYGGSDGDIATVTTGGVAPYTYLWSNGMTTSTITGLQAGSYTVTATDALLNLIIASWLVTQPPQVIAGAQIVMSPCPYNPNGSISLTTNGSGPYTFLWSTGATTQNITGLMTGAYTVTVSNPMCEQVFTYSVGAINPICINTSLTGIRNTTVCIDALNTIYTAGLTTSFQVIVPGDVTLIAGHNIRLMEGTQVFPGGRLHGLIAPDGPFCNQVKSLVSNSTAEGHPINIIEKNGFVLYPNPTNGKFVVEQKCDTRFNSIQVEIYGFRGERLYCTSMTGLIRKELNASELAEGLHFVRIVADNTVVTIKLVRTK